MRERGGGERERRVVGGRARKMCAPSGFINTLHYFFLSNVQY